MSKNKIIHEGEITLGKMVIPCYVLEDGTRILSGNAMQNALKLQDESDNKSLYKSVNMEQLSNWKPDWLNESGTNRRSSEDNAQYANVREAILCTLYGECIGEEKLGWQLAASAMYSQIHLHSKGLKTVLHRLRFEAFGKKEWSEVSGNSLFIQTVEEIFEKRVYLKKSIFKSEE